MACLPDIADTYSGAVSCTAHSMLASSSGCIQSAFWHNVDVCTQGRRGTWWNGMHRSLGARKKDISMTTSPSLLGSIFGPRIIWPLRSVRTELDALASVPSASLKANVRSSLTKLAASASQPAKRSDACALQDAEACWTSLSPANCSVARRHLQRFGAFTGPPRFARSCFQLDGSNTCNSS